MKFEIEIYETDKGEIPFAEFLAQLTPKLKSKILRDLDVLEVFGNELREPYSKFLEDGIFEMRTIFGKDVARTLYFFCVGQKIVITHGFAKKQQKTPQREIDRAKKYRDDWMRRNRREV